MMKKPSEGGLVQVGALLTPEERELSQRALEVIWTVFYWTAFALCWAVLPFMMAFVMTGEFTLKARMRQALRDNLRYYTAVGCLGLLFLLYLWWNSAFEK